MSNFVYVETIKHVNHGTIERLREQVEELAGIWEGKNPAKITNEELELYTKAINLDGNYSGLQPVPAKLVKDIWNGIVERETRFGLCEDECKRFVDMLSDGDTVEIAGNLWFNVHVINGVKYFIDNHACEVSEETVKYIAYELSRSPAVITINGEDAKEIIDY